MAKKRRELAKSAFDCKHVKSVTVWAILFPSEGGELEFTGKIVADYSDNPNGSVVTLTAVFFGGPLAKLEKVTGQAGGYGYDKFSAAFSDALARSNYDDIAGELPEHENPWKLSAAGHSRVRAWLQKFGYTVLEVV